MVWRPGDGFKYSGRRSDGWPDDNHAPDGYLVSGFRKVRKGGILLASGQRWKHDELLKYVGKMVRFQIEDPYSTTISIFVGAHAQGIDVTPHNYIDHHSSFYTNGIYRDIEWLDETKHATRTTDNMRAKGYNV